MKIIKDCKNLQGKYVLTRVDFNVALKKGKPIDDFRLKAALPTINYLVKQKAKVILISHFGRPSLAKTKKEAIKKYSLKPLSKWLIKKNKIFKNLKFIDDPFKEAGKKEIQNLKEGDIALLENIRFWPEEENNNVKFGKKLARLGDIYVNEAFSVCHRNHCSVVGVAKILPSYGGIHLQEEVKNLNSVLKNPAHPLALVVGGAKIKTKLGLLENFKKQADFILIGGAISNLFFKEKGFNVGQFLAEESMIEKVKKILKQKNLVLPKDVVIKTKKGKINNVTLKDLNSLKSKDFQILDIGLQTRKEYSFILKKAKEIIWNGPLGYFEEKPFDKGTKAINQTILSVKKARITIGGGETISLLRNKSQISKIKQNIFISTGGGAMLEFLGGQQLPGLKVLGYY